MRGYYTPFYCYLTKNEINYLSYFVFTAVALNSIACECLDMLEQKVPVLQKPATEVMNLHS